MSNTDTCSTTNSYKLSMKVFCQFSGHWFDFGTK